MNGTAPRYLTLSALRDYLSNNGDLGTAQDGLLTDCILRAESGIDSYTRRSFGTTLGTHYLSRYESDMVRNQALYLNTDLYGIVGGTIWNGDGQVIPVGSTWLEPRNEGPPFRIIRLRSSYVWTWNTDESIAIPGAWGFTPYAPDDIQQAVVRWAAYLYKQKDVGLTDVSGFQDAGGEVTVAKGMPDDVRYLLAPYRSRTGGVV